MTHDFQRGRSVAALELLAIAKGETLQFASSDPDVQAAADAIFRLREGRDYAESSLRDLSSQLIDVYRRLDAVEAESRRLAVAALHKPEER